MTQVVVRDADENFDYLKGRNILSLNLGAEARRAYLSCPDCRKVRFTRVLPGCVVADFLKRKAVAVARFYKNFSVDEQGVLFEPGGAQPDLPVIYGLETKIFAPRPGMKNKCRELTLALDVIRGFNGNKAFKGFALKKIDVSDPESAGFFILLPRQEADYSLAHPRTEWRGFEVRTGMNDVPKKMMILGGLLTQWHRDWDDIKYIDLRFKEPLVKLKNAK
ncbi:MAG: cell division protein FtsQ/DivIB [Candidatus Omnitrophica bacterium]|nr:cell division protein FtsQ/DivIB [Candidatus Omnitrophota bacterium]